MVTKLTMFVLIATGGIMALVGATLVILFVFANLYNLFLLGVCIACVWAGMRLVRLGWTALGYKAIALRIPAKQEYDGEAVDQSKLVGQLEMIDLDNIGGIS